MFRNRAETGPKQAGDALRHLVDLVSHGSGSVLVLMDQAAVTLPQVLLMARVERFGSASLSDLAEGSPASAAALSQMIERLVRQGLLDRAEDKADRRRKAIRITPRARDLLRRLEAARAADYELGLSPVSRELRDQLAAVLEQVVTELKAHRSTDTATGRANNEVSR